MAPITTTSAEARMTPSERSMVARLEHYFITHDVETSRLNWFEMALTAEHRNAFYDDEGTPLDSDYLVHLRLNMAGKFTPEESTLFEQLFTRSKTDLVVWRKSALRSGIPLSSETFTKLIRGNVSTDELLYCRGGDLTVEQVYEALIDLRAFTPLESVTAQLDPVKVIDIVSHPGHLLDRANNLRLYAHQAWGDESWWHDYVWEAVNFARNMLNVGNDVPDDWCLQAVFQYPEVIQKFLE